MANNSLVDLDLIHPHPANVRESLGDLTELAASIDVAGVLQPLVVQPHPDLPGNFRLLAGHRRLAAARLVGRDVVPVTVRHGVDDSKALELMLIENCQRRELGAMEKAEAMGALRHRGLNAASIAQRTGLAASSVSYYLTLLELDDASRAKVRSGELRAAEAVQAVRRTRQRARVKAGSTATWEWEPDYLSGNHPLARKARRLCDAREHTMRRRIGKTACGQCWESAIREDERVAVTAMAGNPDGDDTRTSGAGPGKPGQGSRRRRPGAAA